MAGTKKSKIGIGNIVSWGATVVIIGLLFKIQHWKYSEFFITAGLGTEAVLFFLIGFQEEPVDPDWTKVYPELREGVAPAEVKVISKPTGAIASLDKMMADAKIGPELISSLGDGLKTFGDKVKNISNVADAGTATQEFTAKLKTASASYDGMNAAFAKASAGLSEFTASNVDAKAYQTQVTKLGTNLTNLNSMYEMELKESSVGLNQMKSFYANLAGTMKNFNESIDDSKAFKDEIGRLSKNLSSLNAVYGNMLSAMNQPKA